MSQKKRLCGRYTSAFVTLEKLKERLCGKNFAKSIGYLGVACRKFVNNAQYTCYVMQKYAIPNTYIYRITPFTIKSCDACFFLNLFFKGILGI